MKEIKINIEAISEIKLIRLQCILDESLNDFEDDTNEFALEELNKYLDE